jgi:hypothetical protein
MREITPDDFSLWLEHPCTEALCDYLRNNIRGRQDMVAQGACLAAGDQFERIGQSYVHNMNAIAAFEAVLADLQYEVLFPKEETDDGNEDQEDARGPDTD